MLVWKHIQSTDMKLIQSIINEKQSSVSDFTYTNILIWERDYHFEFAIDNDFLFIKIKHAKLPIFYWPPIGKGDFITAFKKLEEDIKERDDFLFIRCVSEDQAEMIETHFKDIFTLVKERNRYDYVYRLDDLVNLPGSTYKNKRALVRKFAEKYNFVYEKITDANKKDVIAFQSEWNKSHMTADTIDCENQGVISILDKINLLNISGGLLRVDGKVVAYSIGEKLTNDTIVMHIEKADVSYEGSYATINNFYLKETWLDKGIIFVNREEDLGMDNLRKAKMIYAPDHFEKKYIIIRSSEMDSSLYNQLYNEFTSERYNGRNFIRVSSFEDADRISEFLLSDVAFDDRNYTPGEIMDMRKNPRSSILGDKYHYWFLENKSSIIAAFGFYENEQKTGGYIFDYVAVCRDFRKQGIASDILDFCEHYIKQLGGRYLLVETCDTEKYDAMNHTLEKKNFTKVGHIIDYYFPKEGKNIYQKKLT